MITITKNIAINENEFEEQASPKRDQAHETAAAY
jgi:hypothetical protein